MDFTRQVDIINHQNLNEHPVTVIGAGGIGSPTVLGLTKMGVENMTIYDADALEDHNLPNQLYPLSDVGKPKVVALQEVISTFTGVDITIKNERFKNQTVSGIVISGVDSMTSRRDIWNRCKMNPTVPLYIEARMGGQFLRIFSFNPADIRLIKRYEEQLYSDEEAVHTPCTEKAIIYTVFSTASLICNQVKKFVMGEPLNFDVMFDLKNMMLITQ